MINTSPLKYSHFSISFSPSHHVFTVLPRYAQQLRHLQGFAQVAAARIGHGVAQLQWKFQLLPTGSKRWIRGGSEHQLSFFWGLGMFDWGLKCVYIYIYTKIWYFKG